MEAMKMENILRAPKAAKVKATPAKAGDSLAVDQVIVEFEVMMPALSASGWRWPLPYSRGSSASIASAPSIQSSWSWSHPTTTCLLSCPWSGL
jgi:hypothetical protein